MKTALPNPGVAHSLPAAASPTDVLRQEHEVILRALTILERFGRDMAQSKSVKLETLRWLADFFKTFADQCHHAKEETHLFPVLEKYGVPKEGGPLGMMLGEHEQGRALVRTFAQADPQTAPEAIRRFVTLLREHIDKENEVLFPMSDEILPPQEQQTLLKAFEAAEQETAGPEVHRRFHEGLERLESEIAPQGA